MLRMNLFSKKETITVVRNKLTVTSGKEEGMNREAEIDIYILLYRK